MVRTFGRHVKSNSKELFHYQSPDIHNLSFLKPSFKFIFFFESDTCLRTHIRIHKYLVCILNEFKFVEKFKSSSSLNVISNVLLMLGTPGISLPL